MQSHHRRGLKWFVGSLIVLVVGLPLLTRVLHFGTSQQDIDARFAAAGLTYTDHYYDQDSYHIHYVSVGDPSRQKVLFVHGSPGSWDTFINFLVDTDLAKKAYLIAVDRPGHGLTGGATLADIVQEADALTPLLDIGVGKTIIVAHSYAGPITTELAIKHQDQIASLILLAPTLEPAGEEHNYWKRTTQVLAMAPLIRTLLSPILLNAALELHPVPDQVRAIEPEMPNVKIPVTIIHGDKDPIAPVSNIEYVVSHFTGTKVNVIRVHDMNHFIPEKNVELVKEEILKNLETYK